MKIFILICTGSMLNDHSNPYIESTTALFDYRGGVKSIKHDMFVVNML